MRAALSLLVCLGAFGCDRAAPEPATSHPGGAIFRFRQRAGPDGVIPPNAVWRAKLQRDAMRIVAPADPLRGGPARWEWLGPGNVGGRLRSILVHPTRPATMWVGSVGGGVFKSIDGGSSWTPKDDYPASVAIASMAIDPTDPNRIYAGTGEGFFDVAAGSSNTAALEGAGVFVSTDGGDHWAQLASTANPSWRFVNRLIVHRTDPRVLLAATGAGIFRSADRGQSWTSRTTERALDIDMHPSDPTRLVAGRPDGVALFSTDGGSSWTPATGISGGHRIELAYARRNANIVYANVTTAADEILVYRSTDGGRSYSRRTNGPGISSLSNYNSAIWVDPTNDDRIVFGGTRVYNSTDGGVTYNWMNRNIHVDFHAFVEHPSYGNGNTILYAASDGGIYETNDAFAPNAGWLPLINGLAVTQFYGAAVHAGSGVIVGGTQDHGTVRFGGDPQRWTEMFGQDGGFAASDPTDPNVFYGETQRLGILRSLDGGRSATLIDGGGPNPIREPLPNFIAPFVLDPNDPDRILAGGDRLWRSDDTKSAARPSWFAIKPSLGCPPASGSDHFADNPPCNISAIAIERGDSNVVWVGHNNGRLFKSTDATAAQPTWARLDAGTSLPDRWVSRIAIDPGDPRRVWVSFMGYSPDNLWRTSDGGATWASVAGGGSGKLPDIPISSVVAHPRSAGHLFVGTDLGLFWSTDDGASWQTSSAGPGLVAIDELVWQDDRRLLAITHGRGVYRAAVDPARIDVVGRGCGATGIPSLAGTLPVIGATQTYDLRLAAANAPASILFAPGRSTPTDLGGGCVLRVPTSAAAFAVGSTDANGALSFGLQIPDDPALVGAEVVVQAAVAASGGPVLGVAELTNGLESTAGF